MGLANLNDKTKASQAICSVFLSVDPDQLLVFAKVVHCAVIAPTVRIVLVQLGLVGIEEPDSSAASPLTATIVGRDSADLTRVIESDSLWVLVFQKRLFLEDRGRLVVREHALD